MENHNMYTKAFLKTWLTQIKYKVAFQTWIINKMY